MYPIAEIESRNFHTAKLFPVEAQFLLVRYGVVPITQAGQALFVFICTLAGHLYPIVRPPQE